MRWAGSMQRVKGREGWNKSSFTANRGFDVDFTRKHAEYSRNRVFLTIFLANCGVLILLFNIVKDVKSVNSVFEFYITINILIIHRIKQ